jgi:hypothetical protein
MANNAIFIEDRLTAIGTTSIRKVLPYKHFLIQYTIASINTSIDIRVEGSLDGTNWFNLDEQGDTTVTSNGTNALRLANSPIAFIRCNFVSETGGTDATIDFIISCAE